MNTERILHQLSARFSEILKENVVGVYLHGSLAMGGFNPDRSDMDLLVVIQHKLTKEVQQQLAKMLLAAHDELPGGGGFELSVILESVVTDFIYPTPFEFHYSGYHREKYRTDEDYICGGFTDPDLAAHLTVIYHRGRTIIGKPIHSLFQPIKRDYYIQSIMNDIEEAPKSIVDSPVYYTLNLCRVLMYMREGAVSSKEEGGEWGIATIPQYAVVIAGCLNQYRGEENVDNNVPSSEYIRFAEYMLFEIEVARTSNI
ncbi:aminoglycoside adenylyltransferase domain-containing protein [Paenibacillus kobensis]|uniref:aminoglycoside adenylyltransferase domain-containing protein n=1 Tax=Paenibacillus kobensis TaxID=59841 RepID=UPI000FDCAFE3|nr:aminoglycoside adenylyltransferase domain-containing protein [Paenibacillus kobensis]